MSLAGYIEDVPVATVVVEHRATANNAKIKGYTVKSIWIKGVLLKMLGMRS